MVQRDHLSLRRACISLCRFRVDLHLIAYGTGRQMHHRLARNIILDHKGLQEIEVPNFVRRGAAERIQPFGNQLDIAGAGIRAVPS